jgi:hypothetical protein
MARDWKGETPFNSVTNQVRGKLNHRWVVQLMGFPDDWLDTDENP